MRKEVVWAIFAGITFGLVVAFGVWRINSTVSSNKKVAVETSTPSPAPAAPGELKVVLDKPSENSVVTEETVTVSGLTKGLTWVTVSGEDGDYILQADSSGAFSQEIDLTPGVNQIKVSAFDDAGNTSTADVLVVYSSAFQLRTAPTDSPSDSTESSDIRQKVVQSLTNTLNKPLAYIGTVTDITAATIEIKTASSDIQQMSITPDNVNVINAAGTTNKQVKTTDIAIGDFIVAMGYVGTNSVLDVQRILITTPITEQKLVIAKAKTVSTTSKILNLANLLDGKELALQPTSKTKLAAYTEGKIASIKLASIEDEDLIIYILEEDDKNTTSPRSLFVLPKG